MTKENYKKDLISELQSKFCPYGWPELEFCIKVAIAVNKNADWVFEAIESYKDSCDDDYKNIDPCYIVYYTILQSFRNEIESLTGVDVIDDFKHSLYRIYANYATTSFNLGDNAKTELKKLLKKHKIEKENLSLDSQYFLNNI